MFLSRKKAFEKTPVNFLSIVSAAPSHDFCKKKCIYTLEVQSTKQFVAGLGGMIHFSGFPILLMVPSRLVDLDFVWV